MSTINREVLETRDRLAVEFTQTLEAGELSLHKNLDRGQLRDSFGEESVVAAIRSARPDLADEATLFFNDAAERDDFRALVVASNEDVPIAITWWHGFTDEELRGAPANARATLDKLKYRDGISTIGYASHLGVIETEQRRRIGIGLAAMALTLLPEGTATVYRFKSSNEAGQTISNALGAERIWSQSHNGKDAFWLPTS